MSNAFPFVSCICPTYNRRKFLPYLLHIFDYQDYPKDRRELIIIDDSPESNQDIIDKYKKDNNVRYIYFKKKLNLGKKRNMLNKMAKGKYIVCFDDDDYYPPNRVKSAVQKMRATKSNLCGSTTLYVFVTQTNKIYKFGPYGPLHCTNGTMAYHREILKTNHYEDHADKAEESFFLKKYTTPLVQMDPFNVMLCISHDKNTVDKRNLLSSGKETCMKLKNIVKDKKLLEFYKQLIEETKNSPPPPPPPMPEIKDGELHLDAVENGQILVPISTIENGLKNKDNPEPIKYRLENILKKMEKGIIKCYNPYDSNTLNLDDVISGKVILSKEYVDYTIKKLQNIDNNEPLIERFEFVKYLYEKNALPTCQVIAINEYTGFEFNQNIKYEKTS